MVLNDIIRRFEESTAARLAVRYGTQTAAKLSRLPELKVVLSSNHIKNPVKRF